MRRLAATALLALAPSAALADGAMPQMDFHNPLTLSQVLWMIVILVALYIALASWGLPQIGAVLENRAQIIAKDLAAARSAKTAADRAVAELNATLSHARNTAQAEIAKAVSAAKALAGDEAAHRAEQLERKLAAAEAQIDAARNAALAAIKPVAEATAASIIGKLTGAAPAAETIARSVDEALIAQKAA
jgi:F-type H+-transporting ATPase subunit b